MATLKCNVANHFVQVLLFFPYLPNIPTKNIPDNVIAAGNPCRVIREITEEDRKYYYKNREFDVEDY